MIQMLRTIVPFELKYRFRNPLTLLLLSMIVFQGIWFAIGFHDYYISDKTWYNAAGIFYNCLSAGGMIFVVVVAMITATTLYRDVECHSSGYLYAYPLNEKRFFFSHFISAWLINLLLMFAYVMGLALMKYTGIAPIEQMGPIPWLQLTHGMVAFTLPNLFIYTATCFFCLVYTKRMTAVYAGVTLVVLPFVLTEGLSQNASNIDLLSLVDPFGYIYTRHAVDQMSIADKNSAFMPLNSIYWTNRLIWMSASILLTWLAYRRFNFKDFIQLPGNKKTKKKHLVEKRTLKSKDEQDASIIIPDVKLNFSFFSSIQKTLRLTIVEFHNATRPPAFKIIMGILILIILAQNSSWNSTYYIGDQHPLTSGMCLSRLTIGFMLIIILMMLSGELFFKEQKTNIWQITGSLAAPIWELHLPKLFAMFGVAFLFAATIFIGAVLYQLFSGFTDFDWLLYVDNIFGYKWGWINYMLYITVVFMLAGITGNRYVTHCLGVGYFIFLLISVDMGLIEELRFAYGLVPGVEDFSEISRYGILSTATFWYFLLWFSLAVIFIITALHFWRRGVGQSCLTRLNPLTGEIHVFVKVFAVLCLAGFVAIQLYIHQQVYETRNFIPTSQQEYEAASYERNYKALLADYNVITRVNSVQVDLYPSTRMASSNLDLIIENKGKSSIEQLYLNLDNFDTVDRIEMDSFTLSLKERNHNLGMIIYQLDHPFESGEKVSLKLKTTRQYVGFTQDGENPQPDLTFNGSFYAGIVPFIGYDDEKELDENRIRSEQGLEKMGPRMAAVEKLNPNENFLSEVVPANGSVLLTVSTETGQTPIAPGKLLKIENVNGRNNAQFILSTQSALQLYVGSVHLQERTVELKNLSVTYQYHPSHEYNIEHLDDCIENTLQFINENLSGYPYQRLRIAEIPYFQDASYVSEEFIALSEKEGWYADYNVDDAKAVIQFNIARDMIRQWLDYQGRIADVQGADMLWTALPSALAFQIVGKQLGDAPLNYLLDKKAKKYNKERFNEANAELPLLQADEAEYLEPMKGSLALYELGREIGYESLNKNLVSWIVQEQKKKKPFVFLNFYNFLKSNNQLGYRIEEMFETVTEEFSI